MIRDLSGRAHHSARAALIGSIALSVVLLASHPGSAQSNDDAPEAEPASLVVETVVLQAEQWCRPVVNAALDAQPLACWMHLTSEPTPGVPPDMVGMNFGDIPPWSMLDLAAISAEIERYEALIAEEVERRRAEESRPPRRPPPVGTTRPTSEANAGKSDDQLEHECFDLWIAASCGTLADRHLAAGEGGGGVPDPSPAADPAPPASEDEGLYDFSQHQDEYDAWWADMNQRARDQLEAECGGGGGAAVWYSDGTIAVSCN